MDVMHLIALNDPDLFIGLWRGTIKVYAPDAISSWNWRVLTKKTWDAHGATVGRASKYLPSSFDRAPRNIAEKINSGYKAWEFVMYLFGLAPALLSDILPELYWQNYCKFVRGIQLLYRRQIPLKHIQEAHQLLCQFYEEFETIYVERKPERIHFLRQSLHLLTHLGPETIRAGPLISYSQWTMETIIGNLGDEIRQDKDPYANISQRGLLRAQTNVLQNIVFQNPLSLEASRKPPVSRPHKDLGDGFFLLWARQSHAVEILPLEHAAISKLWEERNWPNHNNWPPLLTFDATEKHTLAVGSLFSEPDRNFLERSYSTVHLCKYKPECIVAFSVKKIEALVAMVPHFKVTADGNIVEPENTFFLVEKPGLETYTLLDDIDPLDADQDHDIID
ncbi:hypothetical protein H0H92_001369 [Tricholoma furcatifolium]|nr:hypothetical protein H0H92_001369 [Tricholoma furcatifolium]